MFLNLFWGIFVSHIFKPEKYSIDFIHRASLKETAISIEMTKILFTQYAVLIEFVHYRLGGRENQ